ncbi:MAG TPA: energy transducer TonB [Edaphobacter sp.]|jgi:outer membrane biosynthesis protein TonB|nr:energy transducer TonB [Edaphobacter sp.]
MTTLVKLCFVALIVASTVPGTGSASPIPASLQQAPTQPPTAAKQSDTQAKPHEPRPNPDASGKYHVGDGVTAPKLIYSVEPEFSEKARKQKIAGNCVVSMTVGSDGKVSDVHVVTSIADSLDKPDKKDRAAALSLDEKAVKAAQQYRFEPATFQGKPVPVELKVGINFQIF